MASYPIPPWLNVSPSDFGSAAARGAEVALGRQRLQEEARQANMRAAAAAQELNARGQEQDARLKREQAETDFQHAYQTAQIGLGDRELQDEEQRINLAISTAMNKSNAQAQAMQRIQAGEDPSKVWMELGPQSGLTGAGMASLMRGRQSLGGAEQVPGLPDNFKAVQTGPGSRQIIRLPPSMGAKNVQAIPVMDPSGKVDPSMYGLPSPSGGFQILHKPRLSDAQALQATVNERKSGSGKTIKQQKVDRAHELAAENPDWTKEEVIDEVNKEFSNK